MIVKELSVFDQVAGHARTPILPPKFSVTRAKPVKLATGGGVGVGVAVGSGVGVGVGSGVGVGADGHVTRKTS